MHYFSLTMLCRPRLGSLLLLGLAAPFRGVTGQVSPCPPLDTTAAWVRINRAWANEAGLHWRNDSLRQVLLALRDRDQQARVQFGARIQDTLYVRQLMSHDSTLAAQIEIILDQFGLPTRSLVGPAGSDAAMLVVQHNWSLQERVLALAQAAAPGEVSPEKLAMLEDRILVHQGKPQRFGTQFSLGPDGAFRFDPVTDTLGLDARRTEAGMPPMKQYVCFLEEEGMRVDRSSLPALFRP